MKFKTASIVLLLAGVIVSCNPKASEEKTEAKDCEKELDLSPEKLDRFGITNKEYLSAASKRALEWEYIENDWYREFKPMKPLKGDLAYEEGVVRRDPSAIIKENGKYYVWYSKSTGKTDGFENYENGKVFPWDRCDIWYATSEDGWTWKEEGVAVARGEKGAYDDRSVFTVEIMKHEGMYYLCYQVVKHPYVKRVKNTVGLAWSTSPNGPWTKSKEPILKPADNGVWLGDDVNDRRSVVKKGDFDSHKVHDPCILPFKGKFYLYYKGEQMGEEVLFGGRQIRHGVAIADNPKGPYVKSKYNPISNSGHEICVWPVNGGIASLITTDGPERNTFQFAEDGINFEVRGAVKGQNMPHAIGLNRTIEVSEENPTAIYNWGLSHVYNSWNYQSIMRFESRRVRSHDAKKAMKKK